MSSRCEDCGRPTISDGQLQHWLAWCLRASYRSWRCRRILRRDYGGRPWVWLWRYQPLWWRFDLRCMQWNDCPGHYPPGYRTETRGTRRGAKHLAALDTRRDDG